MLKRAAVSFAVLFIFVTASIAGGRGGHVTAFDPNLFGGGWTCFRTQASGACGVGAFARYFDAPCNGSSDDTTALLSWISYGISQGNSTVKLYIPPGSQCVWGSRSLTFDNFAGFDDPAIKNSVVWAYGASADGLYIGGRGVFIDGTHQALVQTASAGATTLTLRTGAEISRFSVGDAVAIGALSLQSFGYPPNFYYFEYKIITAINGSILTLNAPLNYTYKSTYPDIGTLTIQPWLSGAAVVQRLAASWNHNFTLYGLKINAVGQVAGAARDIVLYDVSYGPDTDGWAPTIAEHVWMFFTYMGSPEVDKMVGYMQAYRSSARQIIAQSASISSTIVFYSSTIGNRFTGWFGNNQFVNSKIIGPGAFGDMFVGPTAYGTSVTALFDGSTINSSNVGNRGIFISNFTYEGNGTFSILKSDVAALDIFTSFAVPGSKNAFASVGNTPNSVPLTIFTITDVREDATKLYFDTDIVGSLPTPLCLGVACTAFYPYPSTTGGITQRFSGPEDLTQYAPP